MPSPSEPRTIVDKLWDAHVVEKGQAGAPDLLYIDRHLIHEVTSPQAFQMLAERGLAVRRPDKTFATMDHATPTTPRAPGAGPVYETTAQQNQVNALEANCARHGIELAGLDSPDQGIVHVIGPELGLTQPGMTIVCGDSHTATHGAFGALAFGIGTTEVGHVLASQCLLQTKPKTMRITVSGQLGAGVEPKDLILAIIAKIGAAGGTGHAIEYAGPAITALPMEARMTICNMSIEAGARAGLIAPDRVTVDWLRGRRYVPHGPAFDQAAQGWLALASDSGAAFDTEVEIDAAAVGPTVTWGAATDTGIAITGRVPDPTNADARQALDYMGFAAGDALLGRPIDGVFIGSCTNGRLSDLRAAAGIFQGRRVAEGVRVLIVPGSKAVKQAAEDEGLDQVFQAAGAEWREPGCSMCLAMNGDKGRPGDLIVSTSNRNFAGRQGPGVRTILASPATAAAAAVAGRITDPRQFQELSGAA
ncbi:MAG: 3-isopropylmalate dehydratase large subunit [Rhodothalassiaceae bacterium]